MAPYVIDYGITVVILPLGSRILFIHPIRCWRCRLLSHLVGSWHHASLHSLLFKRILLDLHLECPLFFVTLKPAWEERCSTLEEDSVCERPGLAMTNSPINLPSVPNVPGAK
jgi:hypothetical protein